jgi:septum formation protein
MEKKSATPLHLTRPLILASASPRRRDLLAEAGLACQIIPADGVEEAHDPTLSPAALTVANAALKARAVAAHHPHAIVLGADTLVYLDDEPLGKPRDLTEAVHMATRLSGRTHTVCTGVCLVAQGGARTHEYHVLTSVTFKKLTRSQIDEYFTLINPLDKAGAYAAQEHTDKIIAHIDGSFSNVVGLPMEQTLIELHKFSKRLDDLG